MGTVAKFAARFRKPSRCMGDDWQKLQAQVVSSRPLQRNFDCRHHVWVSSLRQRSGWSQQAGQHDEGWYQSAILNAGLQMATFSSPGSTSAKRDIAVPSNGMCVSMQVWAT